MQGQSCMYLLKLFTMTVVMTTHCDKVRVNLPDLHGCVQKTVCISTPRLHLQLLCMQLMSLNTVTAEVQGVTAQ